MDTNVTSYLKKANIRLVLIFSLLIVFSIKARSQEPGRVDPETARIAATAYFNNIGSIPVNEKDAITLELTESKTRDGELLFYVFNINKNGGFIIVSAVFDAPPVLCHILQGQYDTDPSLRPPAFNEWMEAVESSIYSIIKNKSKNKDAQELWNAYLSKGQLDSETLMLKLTTKWHQDTYFNYYSPQPGTSNGRSPTGCVATAMGQIMKYYTWPLTGTGYHTYTDPAQPNPLRPCDDRIENSRGVLSFSDFGLSRSYDYSLMPDVPNSINYEISKLLYHSGVSVNMDYAGDASWSNTYDVPNALRTYFSYDNSVQYVNRSNYSDEEWIMLLKEQIRLERPVQYRGENSTGCNGHSWVCYGYVETGGETKFYFNWGWGGSYNGAYNIDLTGFVYNLTYKNGAVINIFPVEQPDLRLTSASVSMDPVYVGVPFTFNFSIKNEGNRDAQNSIAACYLSNDQILDKYDIFIDTIRIKSLIVDQTISRTKSATIDDANTGTYYLLIEADSEHNVHESDENSSNAGVPENLFPVEINITGIPAYDYQTISTGNWTNASTWEYFYDGVWHPATTYPGSSSGKITIRNDHTISLSANLSVDQLTVESGGQINILNGITLTILNGSDETDLDISGTLINSGTIDPLGTIAFNSGSTYQHARNGGVIPRANWDDESTCLITGITGTSLSGFDQVFGNFTYNCTGQTTIVAINNNTTVNGDFTLLSTGSGTGRLALTNSPTARTLTVLGDYIQSGGRLDFSSASSGTSSSLYVAGNFLHSSGAGTITVSGNNVQNGLIVFNGSGQQALSFVYPNGAQWVSYTITSGSIVTLGSDFLLTGVPEEGGYADLTIYGTLDLGTHIISENNYYATAGSRFYLKSGATITTANKNTTGALTTSGSNGSIQVGGERSYSTGANYVFNGSGSQVSGNGLPLTVNSLGVAGTSILNLNNTTISKSTPLTISGDLTISSDAGMTVGPVQAVTVKSDVVNDGNLNLEADGTGMASLLIKGSYSGGGNTKSEIWMTGGEAGTEMWRWHYFAVPSQRSSASLAGSYGVDIMKYDDDVSLADKSDGWNWYDGYDGTTSFADLYTGNGYAFYNDNNVTMELNGSSLLTSLGTVNLNYAKYGWNLIGNSLTCGLNWDSVTFDGQVDHSISFIKDYEEYYYVQGGPGLPAGTTGHIPPLQGFFVQALESGTSIDFSGAKEHNATAYYKGNGSNSEKGTDHSLIRLSFGKGDLKDETVIWFREEATMEYDYRFDAEKWYSEGSRPQIYSVLSGREFAINCIPLSETIAEIPLGLWMPESGSYTINLMEMENIGNYDIFMKDLVNNTKTRLDHNYSFTFSSQAGPVRDRFIIAIENRTTGTDDMKDSEKPFRVYNSFGFINIELLDETWEGKTGRVSITDLTGKVITVLNNLEFGKSNIIQISSSGMRGIYFVEIKSMNIRHIEKILVLE